MTGLNAEPIISTRRTLYDGIPTLMKWVSPDSSLLMNVNATIIPLKENSEITFLLDTNSTPEIKGLQVGDTYLRHLFKSGLAKDRYLCTNYSAYKLAPTTDLMRVNSQTDNNLYVSKITTTDGWDRDFIDSTSAFHATTDPVKAMVTITAAKDTLLFLYDVGFQLLQHGVHFIQYTHEFVSTVQRILGLVTTIGDTTETFITALGYIAPEYMVIAENIYNTFRAITTWSSSIINIIPSINNMPAIEDQDEYNEVIA